MHAYAGVSVCIQCRQVYAGCFPGDKYAGMQVGRYAGIASMDVYSMF